ncbi:MAG TPA: DUF4340 domain-containing protein [Stenomitos sp.]
MNWKGTAALVAIGLGLGAYAYFVEAKKDAPPATDTQEVKLWDLKDDKSVNRLVLEDGSGKKAEYVRKTEAEGWRYAPQATQSLEAFNWDGAYGNLASLTADRKVDDSVKDPKEYGLDKPTLKVALGDATKPERFALTIGGKTPLDSSAYYVTTSQDKGVYQISSWKVDGWTRLVSAPPVASPSPTPATASAAPAHK